MVTKVSGADHYETSKWQKTAPSGARARVFRAFSQPEEGNFRLENRKMKQATGTL